MSIQYSFIYNGAEYQIDNSAYLDETCEGVFFEVKKCPKCTKINSRSVHNCYKCGEPLAEDTICIASRVKRTGLGLWIGSGIWGVIIAALNGAKIRLGGIPTAIILGGCYFIGKAIAGRKIVVETKATEDYRSYMAEQSKKVIHISDDEDMLDKYALIKECKACGKKTETDSKYCSNCGRQII